MNRNPGQFLVGPDVEAGACAALREFLGVPAATEWPRTLPDRFIVVSSADGGGDVNLVQSAPLLLVECFGPSSVESSRLARRASARLRNVAAGWPGVSLARVECGWPVNYPDPRTSKNRHQFTVTAVVDMEIES